MTRGAQGSEPTGIVADVFYILAMHARRETGMTATALGAAIAAEDGTALRPTQVSRALQNLARRVPPLTAYAERWTITAHGYRMLAAWTGDDEPEPCGTGWPSEPLSYPPVTGYDDLDRKNGPDQPCEAGQGQAPVKEAPCD